MLITLKRADFYARAALKAATETKYEPTLKLSVYAPLLASDTSPDAVTQEIKLAREKLIRAHELAIALIRANFAIRSLLAEANMKVGVSPRLTEAAQLEAEETRIKALIRAIENDSDGESSPQAVMAKAKANREKSSERIYGREDSVTASVLTDDDELTMRKQLKRIVDARAGAKDALTALNVFNRITLDSQTVTTLREADILPAD